MTLYYATKQGKLVCHTSQIDFRLLVLSIMSIVMLRLRCMNVHHTNWAILPFSVFTATVLVGLSPCQ